MQKYSHDGRFSYTKLKDIALSAFYEDCITLGFKKRRPAEYVWASISLCFEFGFENPIEDIMWSSVLYILSGSWYGEYGNYYKRRILDHLEVQGIDNLLADVPQDEADQFKNDLRYIGLIE